MRTKGKVLIQPAEGEKKNSVINRVAIELFKMRCRIMNAESLEFSDIVRDI